MDEEGRVVEGPREEEDLRRGAFGFCGLYHGGYGFEVVLEMLGRNGTKGKRGNTYRYYANYSVSTLFCCFQHLDRLVVCH